MYRGVLYEIMGHKAEAQADLAVLQKINPHYAKELEEFIKDRERGMTNSTGAAKKVKFVASGVIRGSGAKRKSDWN